MTPHSDTPPPPRRVIELTDLFGPREAPAHEFQGPTAERPPRHFWRWELTLWAAAFGALASPLAVAPLFDARAARLAQAAWEMTGAAQRFTPRLAGAPDFSIAPAAAAMLTPFYTLYGKTPWPVATLGIFFGLVQLLMLRRLTARMAGAVGARYAVLALALAPGWLATAWTDPALSGAMAAALIGIDFALGSVRGAPHALSEQRVLPEGASIHAWLFAGAAFGAAGLLAMRADAWVAALAMALIVSRWRGRLQRISPVFSWLAGIAGAAALAWAPAWLWARLYEPEQAGLYLAACRSVTLDPPPAPPRPGTLLAVLISMKYQFAAAALAFVAAAARRRLRMALPMFALFLAGAAFALIYPGETGRAGVFAATVAAAGCAGLALATLRVWMRPRRALRWLYVVTLGLWVGAMAYAALTALTQAPHPEAEARQAAAWIERQGLAQGERVGWIGDSSPALVMFYLDHPCRPWPADAWPELAEGPAPLLRGMRYAIASEAALTNPTPESAPAWRLAAHKGGLVVIERQLKAQ